MASSCSLYKDRYMSLAKYPSIIRLLPIKPPIMLPTVLNLFTGVRLNNFRLFNHYAYFHLWSNFYSQTMVIFPYLLMGPSLFTGLITLGVIQQVSNAFGKVNEAFSYLIERWTDITELRSIYKRLTEFEKGLVCAAQ